VPSDVWSLLLITTVVLGCAGRIGQWASHRSYSHDEISVLFSIRTLPLGELLFGRLVLDQGSPMLWLASERTVLELFGHGERTMRLVPMLFACASVVLVAVLARWVLRPPAAVVATALFAIAPLTAFYAWQTKSYSSDTAAVAALLLLAVWLTRRSRWTWRDGLGWWSAATLAAGFSFPALFVAGGVGFALVAGRLLGFRTAVPESSAAGPPAADVRGRFAECVRFCLPSVLWIGAAAAIYWFQLRNLDGRQGDYPMWRSGYAPTGASPGELVTWAASVHGALVGMVWLTPERTGLLVLAIVGAPLLWRRDRAALLVVAAPWVIAFGTALAHVYPLKGRLALWVVPSLVILIAEPVWPWRNSADFTGSWWRRPTGLGLRLAAAAAVCLVIAAAALPAAKASAYITANPSGYDLALRGQGHDIAPLLDTLRSRYRPGDRFVPQETYFNKSLWYGHERGLHVDGVLAVVGSDNGCQPDAYRRAASGAHRIWFIGGESWLVTRPAFVDVALAGLRTVGRVTAVASHDGVTLYRVDVSASPNAGAAPSAGTAPCARFGDSFGNPLE